MPAITPTDAYGRVECTLRWRVQSLQLGGAAINLGCIGSCRAAPILYVARSDIMYAFIHV